MHFTRLWPLGFLVAIPVLILLYMLKKQNQPKVVSSIFLWQEIYETTYVDKPWQKFRNHILFILQLLAILLVVLALMAPHAPWGQNYYKNVIFVVDQSASMNAKYKETTRLEAAKKWMKDYVEEAGETTKGYIITSGSSATLTLAGSSKKQNLISSIEQIEPTYSTTQIEEGIQMAEALGESLQESYEIVVLTDHKMETAAKVGRYVYFGQNGLNSAITLMSHQVTDKGMTVLVQVINKGIGTYSGDLSLYGGNKELGQEQLLDVREVHLVEGESTTVHFEILEAEYKAISLDYLKGELSIKDALEEDNTYYYIPSISSGRKVLLITEGNVFLEKGLMTLDNCEVYKTNDITLVDSDEDYDLYVFDGQIMTVWPKQGNLLLVNCEVSTEESNNALAKELQSLEQVTSNLDKAHRVEGVKENLPDYLSAISFVTNQITSYKRPYWGESILQTEGQVIGFIGDYNGQKLGVLGFDLWSSDFVLTTDFPLMMQYLGGELLDTSRVSQYNFKSNEIITLRQNDLEEQLKVTNLEGKESTLKDNQIISEDYLGVYKITTFRNNKEILSSEKDKNLQNNHQAILLAVNYPSETESNLQEAINEEVVLGQAGSLKGDKNLTSYLIILVLGVVLVEWYFYRKGY